MNKDKEKRIRNILDIFYDSDYENSKEYNEQFELHKTQALSLIKSEVEKLKMPESKNKFGLYEGWNSALNKVIDLLEE